MVRQPDILVGKIFLGQSAPPSAKCQELHFSRVRITMQFHSRCSFKQSTGSIHQVKLFHTGYGRLDIISISYQLELLLDRGHGGADLVLQGGAHDWQGGDGDSSESSFQVK